MMRLYTIARIHVSILGKVGISHIASNPPEPLGVKDKE
jgi:hypothetical protein